MNTLSLQTTRCIVTGEPATIWSGYVVAQTWSREVMEGCECAPVLITAGFKDIATYRAATSDGCGGHGMWKPEDGVEVEQE
jgi:hypothetical protein